MKTPAPAKRRLPLPVVALELVIFLLLALLNTVPLLWGALTSLKPANVIFAFPPKIVGFAPTLEHYVRIVSGGFFLSMVVSVYVSAGCIAAGVLLAALAAYGFDRFDFRLRRLLFFFVVLGIPLAIGSASLLIPNYLFMTKLGLTNKWFTLIVIYSAYQLPMSIWIMKGAFETVPKEIDEAATIEGCGEMYVLFHFLLPLSKPAIAASALFLFIGAWNEFITAAVMVDSVWLRPIQLAIYNYLGYYGLEWGPLTASATLAVIPIVVVFTRLGRLLISGLTQGSVKQ